MQNNYWYLFLLSFTFLTCQNKVSKKETKQPVTTRIAFGSCAKQDKAQPLLNLATELKPDFFIYLGDNIYGDTRDMDVLKKKYAQLAAKSEFQQLLGNTKVLAVWDDHDFGENDAGRHYPFKAESKAIFLDFWKVPADGDRRKHEGIYGVEYLEKEGHKVQILLLDTRTFRDDLIHRDSSDTQHKNDYVPNSNPDSTFLGKEQWAWLAKQFAVSADVRIIASSNQFSHSYNGWESWTNVPRERQRMIELIQKTKANGVVFISGDVHWGEISKLEVAGAYPIYDVTSSGITETWDIIEPNDNRIGKAVPQNNIGFIEIEWKGGATQIDLAIYDGTQQRAIEHRLNLSEISF